MRKHIISELVKLAGEDERVCLMVGDLGFNVVEEFAGSYPERFINCGIAEDNMMAAAAGMALEGDVVFVYSIGNFPTLRCLEQIRNDVCYHRANVNIISVGGGFSYGSLGMTHHTTEELAILRALPEMKVYAPADHYEAAAVLRRIAADPGPSYMRLARGADKELHKAPVEDIDRLVPIGEQPENSEVTLISAGIVWEEALAAAERLREEGLTVKIFTCPSIKPFDSEGLKRLSESSGLICTIEEHNIIGGLGGAAAEVLAELGTHAPLLRFGLKDVYSGEVGSTEHLRRFYGIDGESVAGEILKRSRG
ncbi:MAG: transketolase [Ruminococcus sp.]|nr:transketolase [Ruminococcus sp.]